MSDDRTATHRRNDGSDGSSGASERWVLHIAHHHDASLCGKTAKLPPEGRIVLGRGSAIFGKGALQDAEISKEHLELVLAGPLLFLTCTGRNGATIQGVPCLLHELLSLSDGDVVSIPMSTGALIFVVRRTPDDFTPRIHPKIIGRSIECSRLLQEIEVVGKTDSTVLIRGESGSGKELTARAIHDASQRRDGRYEAFNCAGLTEELFQSEFFGHKKGAFSGAVADHEGLADVANQGTLFLDEVAEANLRVQAKFLRFFDNKQVQRLGTSLAHNSDVRLVSASNADFERLVVDGLFRRDFYFRIKGPEIRVPSLRERRDDIPILAAHFRDKFDHPRERPLSHELMLALLCHSWPGNIRELSQVLRTAVDFAGDALRIPLSPKVVALLAGASRLAVASEPAPAHASEVPSSQVLRQPLMPWSRLPQGYSSTPPPIPGPQDKPESSSPPVTSPRPAEKSRKPPLSHAELERLMEQTDRNISAAAVKADVRRPTLYRWLQKAKIKFRE